MQYRDARGRRGGGDQWGASPSNAGRPSNIRTHTYTHTHTHTNKHTKIWGKKNIIICRLLNCVKQESESASATPHDTDSTGCRDKRHTLAHFLNGPAQNVSPRYLLPVVKWDDELATEEFQHQQQQQQCRAAWMRMT